MRSATGFRGLAVVLLALSNGCGGSSDSDPSGSGELTGGEAGYSGTGGVSAGGTVNGGDDNPDATGGGEPGGAATSGAGTGGTSVGGLATGGASMAGSPSGGGPTGGVSAGGAASGGSGAPSGGSSTGGTAGDTGGIAPETGGAGTGGAVADGGVGTGGATPEGGAGTSGAAAAGGAGGTGGDTPVDASLDVDRSRMDFGTIVLGTTATDTFIVTNRGASISGVPSLSVDSAGAPNPVVVSGCEAALAPGESCSLTIRVTPPELGLFDTFVRLTADPGTDPRLSIYVVGRASGFEVAPPSVLDFGDVPPDVPLQHSITVTATIALSDLEMWVAGNDVSIDAATTTCTDSLAAGDSCVVTMEFLAPDVGWASGFVGIRAGGSMGDMSTVSFTANVTSANDLAVAPENPPPFIAYYEETTDPVVFTVTNVGDAASGPIVAAVVGESGSEYAISDSDCTTLAPQETCTVSVVCSPPMSAAVGTRDAILSITDGSTHVAIPLSAQVRFRD